MNETKWLDWANELRTLALAGIYYGESEYIVENYKKILKKSFEILEMYTDVNEKNIEDFFIEEKGYQTPKMDSRAVIIRNNKILLVKEKNLWTLPGGLVDEKYSIKEYIVKNCRKKFEIEVNPSRLLLIHDNKKHNNALYIHNLFKFFVLCNVKENILVNENMNFFPLDNIIKLNKDEISYNISYNQIEKCFIKFSSNDNTVEFD